MQVRRLRWLVCLVTYPLDVETACDIMEIGSEEFRTPNSSLMKACRTLCRLRGGPLQDHEGTIEGLLYAGVETHNPDRTGAALGAKLRPSGIATTTLQYSALPFVDLSKIAVPSLRKSEAIFLMSES